MKKILTLLAVFLLFSEVSFASSYQATQNYKLNEYNSRGQKIGYTKVYYQGDKSNVQKVESYNTQGKQTRQFKR